MKTLGWIGTVASVIGSFAVALHFMRIGYVLFLFGSVSWLIVGIVKKDNPLSILNGFFLAANLLGLFNSIG